MLDSVTNGFGSGAIAPRSDPQKVFEALGLNKKSAVGGIRGAEKAENAKAGETQSANRQAETTPPPSQTGGADAQSLVQGLIETADTETAQNSAAAAQSLYTEAQGLLTGTL
ncbi:MAG: hypothetical protein AAFY06_15495 [Pseudomonadota bacterium]